MTDGEFEAAVRTLRKTQSAYFSARRAKKSDSEVSACLHAAYAAERDVDAELKRRDEMRRPRGKTLLDLIDEFGEPPTERQLGALE